MDDRVYSIPQDAEQNYPAVNNSGQERVLSPEKSLFLAEVIQGLQQSQKTLPCKYFYDEKGSQLFEQICELNEYYITRTELALLDEIKIELAELIGENATIIEPGAGAGIKIRTLLKALTSPESYVPMDISKDFLFYSAQIIQNQFPDINIMPIQGDFTQPVKWLGAKNNNNRVVFFPGSTIGNFETKAATDFLKNMQKLIGQHGGLIVGVDLMKDPAILEAAYDDSLGITAKFNKNLLARINKELNADFDLQQFEHQARVNQQLQRVEMHLISRISQQVNINGQIFSFDQSESIHTENSHKYTIESFLQMASAAKLKSLKYWMDEEKLFSVHYLTQMD